MTRDKTWTLIPGYNDSDYRRVHVFIGLLRGYRGVLTQQELRSLKGQALAGDLTGAQRGLEKLLRR